MDFKEYISGFLIFALFIIALISFGVQLGINNDADILITDNSSVINSIYENVNDTIYNYKDSANDSYSAFNTPGENTGFLSSISEFFISSILYVGKSIMGVGNAIFNVTLYPILKAIGLPKEVAQMIGIVISMILLFTIVLMAWRLYKIGE